MHGETELSDEDLIRASRVGDGSALETLYSRHHHAGLRFARRLMANKADAEDVTQEAFLKVAAAIGRGNGPETAFRPYLLRAVGTAAADRWQEQAKETPTEGAGDGPVEDPSFSMLLHRDEPELVMKAFQSLPLRWMTVLWHAEVEREPPRRIAPVLGMEPGAVSALLLRARKGLREAYLTAYAQAPPRSECEPTFPFLAATVLGTSSARDRRKVTAHTRDCEDCAKVLAELSDVGKTMRGILAPLILFPSGVVLPYPRLLPKYSTGAYTAILTAVSVFVAAAAVAGTSALILNVTPTAIPASPAASVSPTIPAQRQAPQAGGLTTAMPPQQAPVPAEDATVPSQYYPAERTSRQWPEAGPVPVLLARLRPPVRDVPPPATAALENLPPRIPGPTPSAAVTTPAPSHTPTLTPSAASTAAPTASPGATPTASAVATPAPGAPTPTAWPAEPTCSVFLLWCLSG